MTVDKSEKERSTEYQAWLEEAQRAHDARIAALIANPEGGVYYRPHPYMVHSGQFWRCKHGTPPAKRGCWKCAVTHPIDFLRWYGWLQERLRPTP